jgi:hypothetical protein
MRAKAPARRRQPDGRRWVVGVARGGADGTGVFPTLLVSAPWPYLIAAAGGPGLRE